MEPVVETLQTPVLLAAMPQIHDPFFSRSVVLLLEHTADGSFGVITNRMTDLKVAALLADLNIVWTGDATATAIFGGPVQPNVGFTIFSEGSAAVGDDRVVEFADSVYLSQDVRVLGELAARPPERFRFVIGYAGWTPGQLEQELERNDWLLVPFREEILFAPDLTSVWRDALATIGIRPESLPSWTPGGPEKAN